MPKIQIFLSLPEVLISKIQQKLRSDEALNDRYKGNRNEFIEDSINFFLNVKDKQPNIGQDNTILYTPTLPKYLWDAIENYLKVNDEVNSYDQIFIELTRLLTKEGMTIYEKMITGEALNISGKIFKLNLNKK